MTRDRHYVHTVDIARGFAAVGVMAYHLLYLEQIAAYERAAFYCVYAFFVISGFSLYITYVDRLSSAADWALYARKRFLRIAPLYYLACGLQVILVSHSADTLSLIPFNLSLAFGFANPGAVSMIAGGWSIGIEMVFYLALPMIIVICGGSLGALGTLFVLSTALMVMFVNRTLTGHLDMAAVWPAYTQPIAFFGYFAFGCLLGEVYRRHSLRLKGRWSWAVLLVLALVPFALVRVEAQNELLTGATGLILMTATMAAVAAAAFLPEPEGVALAVGRWLGRLSYPVYLLHSIVYAGIVAPLVSGSLLRIALTVMLTIVLSTLVHLLIEERFRVRRRS